MRPALFLLSLALLLAGCHSPDEPLPYPLTLNGEGLGPVRLGGPFDVSAIQGKLPGFTVEKMTRVTSERSETLFFLKRGDAVLAQIFPDKNGEQIAQIILCSDRIEDGYGQKIGTPIRRGDDLRCDKEQCRYDGDPSLVYRIDPSSDIIREITLQKL